MKPGSTPFVLIFSKRMLFASDRLTLIPAPMSPFLIWSSTEVEPALRIVLRFLSPVGSFDPAAVSTDERAPRSLLLSPLSFSVRSLLIAASMRRAAAAARSSGVRHAARFTPLNGSSRSFWRTAFWSSGESSSILGEVSNWRLTSPTKRFWRMGTRQESVVCTSQARSGLFSWLREPSTVSKAWVPSEP